MRCNSWTEKEINFLREHYLSMTHKEIAEVLNRTAKSVKAKAKVLKFAKPRFRFTSAQIIELKEKYADTNAKELAQKFGCPLSSIYGKAQELKLKKSSEFVRETARRQMSEPTARAKLTQFRKGLTPWSKGKKLETRGRSGETQFKKGQKPHNHLQVGHILPVSNSSYLKIKIAEPNRWEFLHRFNWTEISGEIPKGFTVVFKDGNPQNCEIDNLEMISRKDLMLRNTIHNYPDELKETIQLLGRLKRRINKRSKYAEEQN